MKTQSELEASILTIPKYSGPFGKDLDLILSSRQMDVISQALSATIVASHSILGAIGLQEQFGPQPTATTWQVKAEATENLTISVNLGRDMGLPKFLAQAPAGYKPKNNRDLTLEEKVVLAMSFDRLVEDRPSLADVLDSLSDSYNLNRFN